MPVRLLLALWLCLALPVLGLLPASASAHVRGTVAAAVAGQQAPTRLSSQGRQDAMQAVANCAGRDAVSAACVGGCAPDRDGCECGCGMGACAHGSASALPASPMPPQRRCTGAALPALASGLRADAPTGAELRPPIG